MAEPEAMTQAERLKGRSRSKKAVELENLLRQELRELRDAWRQWVKSSRNSAMQSSSSANARLRCSISARSASNA